jgi:hypothetical protein
MSKGESGISCISPHVRSFLLEELEKADIDKMLKERLIHIISNIFPCEDGCPIRFGDGKKSNTPHVKKESSPYNEFIKECMKSRPDDVPPKEYMKECANMWKELKEE